MAVHRQHSTYGGLDPDLVLQGGPLHLGLDQDGYGVQAVQIAVCRKKSSIPVCIIGTSNFEKIS
jgi:hypothetical protein